MARSTFRSQNVTNTHHARTTLDLEMFKKVHALVALNCTTPLHYTTLHYTNYTTPHYTTLHRHLLRVRLQLQLQLQLHYITLGSDYTTQHYITLHYIRLQYTTLQLQLPLQLHLHLQLQLYYTTPHYTRLHCTTTTTITTETTTATASTYAQNSFGMIVATLSFGDLYSTLWPSTMLGCYNLMALGLRTQKRF